MKLALSVGYHGEGFSGSQYQPDKRTVEGEFIKAGISCGAWDDAKSASFRTAGRTDKGVSARRQLITVTPRNAEKFVEAINFHLPPDIWCTGYTYVDDDFYPRYAAGIRTYRYFFPYPLDTESMQKAASYFVGVHDFSGFSKMETGRDPMRTVTSASVFTENGLPVFEVSAKSFLWNMVRGMAGILEAVGLRLTQPETVSEQLKSHIWRVHPAPPAGLVFWDIETSLEFTSMRQRTAAKRQLFEKAKEARTSAHTAEALLGCVADDFLIESAEKNYGSFMKR